MLNSSVIRCRCAAGRHIGARAGASTMFGGQKKAEGFEWHRYVRTTIKLKREARREKVDRFKRSAAEGGQGRGRGGWVDGQGGRPTVRGWRARSGRGGRIHGAGRRAPRCVGSEGCRHRRRGDGDSRRGMGRNHRKVVGPQSRARHARGRAWRWRPCRSRCCACAHHRIARGSWLNGGVAVECHAPRAGCARAAGGFHAAGAGRQP